MPRRVALAVSIAAAVAAAALYLAAAQRTQVVVAARDLEPGRPLSANDVATVSVPADAVPRGAIDRVDAALGRYLAAPVHAGQSLVGAALRDAAPLFRSGATPPAGTRAVAVPVEASHALGGAIAAGWRVDIVAVPIGGRAPEGRPVELVARGALVLDVRSASGRPFVREPDRSALAERVGSIVVAIPAADELRFAERVLTSTFVVLLAPDQ